MTQQLNPCPFCGGTVKTSGIAHITTILCDTCGACVSFRRKESKDKTMAAWNRRHNDPSQNRTME